ncbi:type I restriction endonuclease subunit R [Sinimarinibacterium flocculans]|uniref:Type I restriction enzyme endonuclease subunit n=1 Tax=Sinimarinibacterium flocculans TaxID=985250 RepID=A0A318E308_9GAMM|nr:type I restriction endonuclease subunit R [Sinimarinibacterium flocculans]PXV65277.1 type I restriction enzyme R subunit [Sinimarinibacterium flocculans]
MSSEITYPQASDPRPPGIREQDIETALIEKLRDLKYTERPDIRDRASLEANFRQKFEALNRVSLTDTEFRRLLEELTIPDVFTAARVLREKNDFTRDDGTPLVYTLVNIRDWCKNDFEVVHQLRINTDYSHHRYDVLLLINGVPVVQIELKTLGVNPRRAMEQIVEYKNDPGNGYARTLLCFIQLFIVSNRTETVYFANNNARHFAFNADERFLPVYRWADRDNKPVSHLDDFADRFLQKCELGRMISRYMVLIQSEQQLLMMRPYQIYAVQAIVDCIDQNCGNGYIWHTTGSGKTLTSFKAATLLRENEQIDKCLFVVDRKDLDRQTREEFNKFQEGCVEENTNTAALVRRLLSDDKADKVIVTTIQKLGLALDEDSKRNKQRTQQNRQTYAQLLAPLSDKRIVFIFDECHRSQFGENHQAIKDFFPRAQLFGFTGTPIFDDNASQKQIAGEQASLRTTVDLFQRELHAYTITNAIEDKNVLRFHVDYYKLKGEDAPKSGRILEKRAVVKAILDKHDSATHARRFNALFATASINDAIEYHALFQTLQDERQTTDPAFVPLKIACVFSPPAQLAQTQDEKKDISQLSADLEQERKDNEEEPEQKKAALKAIIADYNSRYDTHHNVNEFDRYYQDVQKRIKEQKFPNADLPRKGAEKIDITIVVDMLLTGFDSKYLNTLYVDKNLKHHGLIQALSRTNRVLNATKPHGQILDFRAQQKAVDEAITLFSGGQSDKAREIWLVDPAPKVVEKLKEALTRLDQFMQSQDLPTTPDSVPALKGDEARAVFIERFREVQRLKTQLDQYTDLKPETQAEVEQLLPRDELNAYRGVYLSTAQRLKEQQGKSGDKAPSPAIEQLDFEFVLFASAVIDYDYIMKLLANFSSKTPGRQSMNREQLVGLIAADAKFIDERELITDYVRSLQQGQGLDEKAIRDGYQRFKTERLGAELAAIAERHGLAAERLDAFVDRILQRLVFDGEQLTELMAPLGLGWRERRVKELALMDALMPVLKKRASGREISGLSAYES